MAKYPEGSTNCKENGMTWERLLLNLIPCFSFQSPLFLMFLDCVWQLLEQYPAAFEFSEMYLTILYDSARISLFGTFLFNCPHQRVKESTVSIKCYIYFSIKRLQLAVPETTSSKPNGIPLCFSKCISKYLAP